MKLLTEFVGTFLFLFAISLIAVTGSPLVPLGIGAALTAMVYAGGHWSGAHYNPAVSLAILIRGKMSTSECFQYMGVQILAGTLAFLLGAFVSGKPAIVAPGANVSAMQALVNELIFTFMLVLTVLNVATAKATEGNSYYGIAIGFVIVCAATAGGGISGGAYNPAVGVGSILAASLAGAATLQNIWIYLVGPFAGAILGAIVFRMQGGESQA